MMDTVMRIWVFACILLFSMRQFLPKVDQWFNVVGVFGMVFVLLIASAVGTTLYRRYKEGLEKAAIGH